jgi:hypothetical protein
MNDIPPCRGKRVIATPLKSGGSNLQGFKNGAVETVRESALNVGLPV